MKLGLKTVSMFAVLGVVLFAWALFGVKTSFAIVYDQSATTPYLCVNVVGNKVDQCANKTTSGGANVDQTFGQRLHFGSSTTLTALTVNIDHCDGSGANPVYDEIYVLDSTQWSSWSYSQNPPVSYLAKSTTYTGSVCSGAKRFTFIPSINTDNIYGFVYYVKNANDAQAKTVNVKATIESYPNDWIRPSDYQGYAPVTSHTLDYYTIAPNTPVFDYVITVETGGAPVVIQSPLNNAYVDSPVTFSGTCNADISTLELNFVNDEPFATSTDYMDFVYPSIPCTASSTWSTYPVGIANGRWNVRAIQATSTDQIEINVLQSSTPKNNVVVPTFTCNIPYLSWDPCASMQSVGNKLGSYIGNTIMYNVDAVTSTKPFAYYFQLRHAIQGYTSATTTSPLSFSTSYASTSIELFNASSTPVEIIGQAQWDSWRPYLSALIHASFVYYLLAFIVFT